MKITPTFFAFASIIASQAAVVDVVPRIVEDGHLNVGKRATGTLEFFTGTWYTGQPHLNPVQTGSCYVCPESLDAQAPDNTSMQSPIGEPYVSSLLSAKASAGIVCFLYTGLFCDQSCAACIDAAGFPNMTPVSLSSSRLLHMNSVTNNLSQ